MTVLDAFSLAGQVAVITGGAGLLGRKHAEAIAEAGGIPVLWDINQAAADRAATEVAGATGARVVAQRVDITDADSVAAAFAALLGQLGGCDILINNAANDPKVEGGEMWSRLEKFPRTIWEQDLAVGLTGAFLCAQTVGTHMAGHGGGVILNIASDLSVISPDQRLYRRAGAAEDQQPVKPVTYSVIKHGLIGLTRYLSTYWAGQGVRANAISPGGVYTSQPDEFVIRLTDLIPMKRMADRDEYKAAIVFLCSRASSYMTGQNLIIDGGRTVL